MVDTVHEDVGTRDIMVDTVPEEVGTSDIMVDTVPEEVGISDIMVDTVPDDVGPDEDETCSNDDEEGLEGHVMLQALRVHPLIFIYIYIYIYNVCLRKGSESSHQLTLY